MAATMGEGGGEVGGADGEEVGLERGDVIILETCIRTRVPRGL